MTEFHVGAGERRGARGCEVLPRLGEAESTAIDDPIDAYLKQNPRETEDVVAEIAAFGGKLAHRASRL